MGHGRRWEWCVTHHHKEGMFPSWQMKVMLLYNVSIFKNYFFWQWCTQFLHADILPTRTAPFLQAPKALHASYPRSEPLFWSVRSCVPAGKAPLFWPHLPEDLKSPCSSNFSGRQDGRMAVFASINCSPDDAICLRDQGRNRQKTWWRQTCPVSGNIINPPQVQRVWWRATREDYRVSLLCNAGWLTGVVRCLSWIHWNVSVRRTCRERFMNSVAMTVLTTRSDGTSEE
jgi:hypothetical protein